MIDPTKTYSVYLLFSDNGLPVYVGSTINFKRRKGAWFRDLGLRPRIFMLLGDQLSQETALALEAHFIKILGRQIDGGFLLNKVLFHKNTGRVYSEETRDKIRKSLLGRKLPPERVEAMRQYQTGRKHSEETRARLKAIAAKRIADPAYIERLRAQAKLPRKNRKEGKCPN